MQRGHVWVGVRCGPRGVCWYGGEGHCGSALGGQDGVGRCEWRGESADDERGVCRGCAGGRQGRWGHGRDGWHGRDGRLLDGVFLLLFSYLPQHHDSSSPILHIFLVYRLLHTHLVFSNTTTTHHPRLLDIKSKCGILAFHRSPSYVFGWVFSITSHFIYIYFHHPVFRATPWSLVVAIPLSPSSIIADGLFSVLHDRSHYTLALHRLEQVHTQYVPGSLFILSVPTIPDPVSL
ncbi:hypothetical protein B0H34DRAFT_274866 [Crassisporium funariophilum]|nr:hypothetical protein B0H34DRAFT_274866 [Crassisporium funariophilum]